MSGNNDQKAPAPPSSNSPINGIQKPTPIQGVQTNSYNPPTNKEIHHSGGAHGHEKNQ